MNYYKIPPYLVIFMVLLLSNYMGQIQNFGKILVAGFDVNGYLARCEQFAGQVHSL